MNTTQYVEATAVIIGLVNGIDMISEKEWKSLFKYLMAIAGGLFFGAIHWFGLPSMEAGLALAIGSSGIYKLFQVSRGV